MESKMIEIVKASGRSYCRGGEKTCIAAYPKYIPKDSKALKISIYGAGGGATAFYCEVCMEPILGKMQEVIEESKL
jgi:hypothetical protein